MSANALHKCVVCKHEKPCQDSLRLFREKGVWMVQPVCPKCKHDLIREAKAKGKFIPFFGLEASQKEVDRRKEEEERNSLTFRPFLEKFGRDRKDKVVGFLKGKKTTESKRSAG